MSSPGISCTAPTGSIGTSFPLVQWDFIPDHDAGYQQASVDVRIFTQVAASATDFDPVTTPALSSVTITDSTARSWSPLTAMDPGDYIAYVRATDTAGGLTPWGSSPFTLLGLTVAQRPTSPSTGSLGCGAYTVLIQERGGKGKKTEVPFDSLRFARKIDDLSDAQVTIGRSGLSTDACCQALSDVRAWQHELSILRDGVEEWVGPVGIPEYTEDQVTVPARDLFAWMERRNLEKARTFVAKDLGIIFRQFVLDALVRDPSPNITVELYLSRVTGDRSIDPNARRRAADELRELARSGVDFTMIARRMLVGGEELPVAPLPPLLQSVVNSPKLVVRGLDSASEVIVVGATDQNAKSPHVGVAGGVGVAIGLVQTTVNESSIQDDASCKRSAQTRIDLLSGTSEFLTVTLTPAAPVSFSGLIPGARWPVAISVACRDVVGTMRLSEVAVAAQVDDTGQTDTVSVTLEPIGTTDEFT